MEKRSFKYLSARQPGKPGKNGRLNAKKNRNKNRNTELFYIDYEMYSRILFVLFRNF